MNDPSDSDGQRDGSSSSGPRRPKPVRPAGPAGAGGERGSGGGSGKKRRREERAKETKKPTPVRDMAAVEAPPPSPTDPDLEEAEVSIDDESWVVRVLGRAGGKGASATPLLLLGFWREEAEGEPPLEALVVGRTLAALTPAALRSAHGEAERPERRPEGKGRGRSRPSRGVRGDR